MVLLERHFRHFCDLFFLSIIISKLDKRRGCVTCGCLHILKSQSAEKIKQGRKPRKQMICAKSFAPATRRRERAFHEYGSLHYPSWLKSVSPPPWVRSVRRCGEWVEEGSAYSAGQLTAPGSLQVPYRTYQCSGSVSHEVKKTLILCLFMTFYLWRILNVPSKSIKQKTKKIFWLKSWRLLTKRAGSGAWCVRPRIRIRTEMSRILNTGSHVVL